jgi:hypothetical protein
MYLLFWCLTHFLGFGGNLMDMTELCVKFARLRGVDSESVALEVTEIVRRLLFTGTRDDAIKISGTYERIRAWTEKSGDTIGGVARECATLGSHIFAAGLIGLLEMAAKKEDVESGEYLVRILTENLKGK